MKSQIDSATLLLAALAGALALTQISGPLAWMSSIGGLIVLLALLSHDQEGGRTVFQSLVFAAVCGFNTAIAAGAVYQLLASHGEVHLENGQWATEYLPLTCALATGIFWAIDVMRMNARKAGPIRVPRALGDTGLFPGSVPQFAAPPAPVAQPAYWAPEPQPAPVDSAPPPPVPVRARESPTATSLFTVPQSAPPSEPQPLHPGPEPIISRSGKEVMIYVSLLGEGLNVMRTVRAEPLGRDYYRIIEDVPEGETWQFQPGQVVRCKKKNLSTGKAMVAMEEAPRAT